MIPGAVESVIAAGVSWGPAARGPFGAVRVRHFGAYPLIENNGVRAKATTLLGAEAGYRIASGVTLRATILNVLNTSASDVRWVGIARRARRKWMARD